MCPHCADLTPVFSEGRTTVLSKGPARSLVLALKYHHGLHVLKDMETIFRQSEELMDWVRGATLIPVPLHPRKERERGFNQSQLIAESLARAAGGATCVETILKRVVADPMAVADARLALPQGRETLSLMPFGRVRVWN